MNLRLPFPPNSQTGYALINSGVSIKVIRNSEFTIRKNSITEISALGQNVIKIGRKDCFSSIVLKYQDVIDPITVSRDQLIDLLNGWISEQDEPEPDK